MSVRVDTASLIAGAVVCGDRGLGVLGSTVLADTATGDHGAGYLYNDVDSGDEAKEFRGLIVTPPSAGTFFAYEDGSFSLVAPDGAYTFVYRLYVDGVDLGTATASVTIGTVNASASGSLQDLSLAAPTGTAAGTSTGTSVTASGALAALTLSAVTGEASAVRNVEATGDMAGITMFAPTFYRPAVKPLRKTQYIPTRSPTDPSQVGVWATGEFERVLNGLEAPFTHELIDVLNEEPGRKLAGKVMLCFADGTNWDPGFGRGLYLYDPLTAVWTKIS